MCSPAWDVLKKGSMKNEKVNINGNRNDDGNTINPS